MSKLDKNKEIDKLSKKVLRLDDICSSIYLALIGRKSLRFNELYRSVIKLNPKQPSGKPFISRPSFNDHLKHLRKKKLVDVKRKGKQNVSYSLSKDALKIFSEPTDDITGWTRVLEKKFEEFNPEKYYKKMTEIELKQEVNRDLDGIIKVSLRELEAFVNYSLKIDENETDDEFWRFIGNRLFRILEKSIAENCRNSVQYRDKFFERLKVLLGKNHIIKPEVEKHGSKF